MKNNKSEVLSMERISMDLTVEEVIGNRVCCNGIKYIILNRPVSSLKTGDRLKGFWIPDTFQDREDSSRVITVNKYMVTSVVPAATTNTTTTKTTTGKGKGGAIPDAV